MAFICTIQIKSYNGNLIVSKALNMFVVSHRWIRESFPCQELTGKRRHKVNPTLLSTVIRKENFDTESDVLKSRKKLLPYWYHSWTAGAGSCLALTELTSCSLQDWTACRSDALSTRRTALSLRSGAVWWRSVTPPHPSCALRRTQRSLHGTPASANR